MINRKKTSKVSNFTLKISPLKILFYFVIRRKQDDNNIITYYHEKRSPSFYHDYASSPNFMHNSMFRQTAKKIPVFINLTNPNI
jgi:hypothetical protein